MVVVDRVFGGIAVGALARMDGWLGRLEHLQQLIFSAWDFVD